MHSSNGLAPMMNSFGVTSSYFTNADKINSGDKEALNATPGTVTNTPVVTTNGNVTSANPNQSIIESLEYGSFTNLIDYSLSGQGQFPSSSTSANTNGGKLTNL